MKKSETKLFPGEQKLPPSQDVLIDNFMEKLIAYVEQEISNEIYNGDRYDQKLDKRKAELRKALEELL